MKIILKGIRLVALVVCSFMIQTGSVVAQTSNSDTQQAELLANFARDHATELGLLTNYARSHNITVREVLNNPEYNMDYQSNAFFITHGMTELEMMSNAASYMHATPWPDSLQKQAMLKTSARLLLSAIDTNQLELLQSKIASLPAVIRLGNQAMKDGPVIVTLITNEDIRLQFKSFSSQVSLTLNECANFLTNPNLNTFSYYEADIFNPKNKKEKFYFSFWSENGPIKTFDKRTTDDQHIPISARFYENGKLEEFRIDSPKHEMASFDIDGKMKAYHWAAENISIDLKLDETGNIKIRGFLIKKLRN